MLKRIISLLLIFVMAFSLTATAFAEEGKAGEEPVLTELEPEESEASTVPEELTAEQTPVSAEPPKTYASGEVASGTCGDNLTWTLSSDGVLTISGSGEMTSGNSDLYIYNDDIKTAILQEGVASIGTIFAGCSNLTSVTIPNSVTSIENYAFRGCTSLKSVTIPSGVTSIGGAVFLECSSLTAIHVDSGNKSYSSVDGVLFNKDKTELIQYPCGKSGSYAIPSGVTRICGDAFSGCSGLTGITIPNSVTSLGPAFSFCTGLKNVTIPNSVTNIWGHTFQGCSGLESVTIPNSVTTIEEYAFSGCSSLKTLTIPDSVTYLGQGAFMGCKTFESVTIPRSVTEIGWEAFESCSGLTSVTIEYGVAIIGVDAFSYCTGLKSLTIPGSVTSFGGAMWCDNLASVTFEEGVTCTVWGFFVCPSLKSVTIPRSVTSIGQDAFLFCSDDLVISGYKGTAAETYAKENGYAFKALDQGAITLATPKLSSVTNTASGVKIKWGAVDGAEKYRVYYKKDGGSWTKITDTTKTSYTWKKAKSGTKYSFAVRCVSADGATETSDLSAAKSKTYIAAPKVTKVENTAGGVKVTWGKVTGAAKYRLYYQKDGGKWTKITDTTKTSYTWKKAKSGTSYSFAVRCVSADGKTNTSAQGAEKSVKYIAAPKISKTESTSKGLKITWGKVTGAAKYRVYYKNSAGKWTKIADTTKTSYTWTKAKSGKTYTVAVRCVSASGKSTTSAIGGSKSITYKK